MSKISTIVAPFLALTFVISTFAQCDVPIHLQSLTFGGQKKWQATETITTPDSHGRHQAKSVTSIQLGGCSDYLTDFQRRPLDVMFQNGYISEELLEILKVKLKNLLDGRQLLLVTASLQ